MKWPQCQRICSEGLRTPHQDWTQRKDGYPTRPLRDGIRPSRDLNQMLKAQQVNIGITETERKILSPNKVTERLQTYQSRAGMMH